MSKDAKKPTLNDILDLAIELARRHADASLELAAALCGSLFEGSARTLRQTERWISCPILGRLSSDLLT